VFEKSFHFRDGCSASSSDREIPFTEGRMQLAKTMDLMQIKHKVTTLADMSSSRGCEMWWISRDQGF